MEKAPLQPTPVGAIRFNTDSSKLETYDGNQWVNLTSTSPEVRTGGTRGGIGGGSTPTKVNNIQYQNLDTTGNFLDFGDLSQNRANPGCVSSRTRAVWCGGEHPGNQNTMDYVTIASTGDATDFGDLDGTARYLMGAGNQVRGILSGGGYGPVSDTNAIEYVTIASTGTGSPDFGDLTTTGGSNFGAYANQTRYVAVINRGGGGASDNVVNSVQIASTGNAIDWGDTLYVVEHTRSCSNSVRGVTMGGRYPNPTAHDSIEYGVIASLGNQLDFGNLTVGRGISGASATPTRAVVMAGATPTIVNTCDYIQIMTTGNAIDFGDADTAVREPGAFSNGHGGLG